MPFEGASASLPVYQDLSLEGAALVEPGGYDARVRCWRLRSDDWNPVIARSTHLSVVVAGR